jgi:hypothetical protein
MAKNQPVYVKPSLRYGKAKDGKPFPPYMRSATNVALDSRHCFPLFCHERAGSAIYLRNRCKRGATYQRCGRSCLRRYAILHHRWALSKYIFTNQPVQIRYVRGTSNMLQMCDDDNFSLDRICYTNVLPCFYDLAGDSGKGTGRNRPSYRVRQTTDH